MTKQNANHWQRYQHFLTRGVWETQCAHLPWPQRFGVYVIRLISLVISGFRDDQCSLHAASLTYFSLMALIPILALMLVMARSFGGADLAKKQFDQHLEAWISQIEQPATEAIAPAPLPTLSDPDAPPTAATPDEVPPANHSIALQVRQISDQLFQQIEHLKFGTLGGIGAVMLLWTVISTLGKVESSFNRVWGIERQRPLVRKCFDYLGVALLLPFLATAASSVPIVSIIAGFMEKTVGDEATLIFRQLLASGLFKFSSVILSGTLMFAFLLGFMPNTRVKTGAALTGGFLTMFLFVGWLRLCTMLQIGIGKYSVLYGSFAVLPIILLWVYVSWQIIMLGAEITFAIQNRRTYVLEHNAEGASLRARLLLALTFCAETARCASETQGGPFAADIFAQRHGIPSRFVNGILQELVRNQILVRVADQPGQYLLFRCGRSLTVADVTRVILDDGRPLEDLGLANLDKSLFEFSAGLDQIINDALPQPIANFGTPLLNP